MTPKRLLFSLHIYCCRSKQRIDARIGQGHSQDPLLGREALPQTWCAKNHIRCSLPMESVTTVKVPGIKNASNKMIARVVCINAVHKMNSSEWHILPS